MRLEDTRAAEDVTAPSLCVDGENQIASAPRVTGPSGDTGEHAYPPGNAAQFVYDPAGNLVSDGVRYYHYDAWNRLIQG